MKKCSTCKLVICLSCEKNLTTFCESKPGKLPIYKGIPEPTNPKEGSFLIKKIEVEEWKPVGEGTWGVVYKAKYHGPVAVKKLKCKNPSKEKVVIKIFWCFVVLFN